MSGYAFILHTYPIAKAGNKKDKSKEEEDMRKKFITLLTVTALGLGVLTGCGSGRGTDNTSASQADTAKSVEITNVSYDPTRELYAAYNELFATHWKEEKGQDISVVQSHGGSGRQALEVANGLQADVVTLALEGDVDAVKDAGLIEERYTREFPLDSSPYTSTIVFLVRKGNPKNIQDWDDLLKDDVGVITPNPKTSGGARWNYLAAWYYFESQGESEDEIEQNMKKLYENVLVLDSGARGATTSFVENGQGDVLLAWENEAFLSLDEHPGEYEIVVPSVSILCQPTVAVVDEVVDKRGTREVATDYIKGDHTGAHGSGQRRGRGSSYDGGKCVPDIYTDHVSSYQMGATLRNLALLRPSDGRVRCSVGSVRTSPGNHQHDAAVYRIVVSGI